MAILIDAYLTVTSNIDLISILKLEVSLYNIIFFLSTLYIILYFVFRGKIKSLHKVWQLKIDSEVFDVQQWYDENRQNSVYNWSWKQTIGYTTDYQYWNSEVLNYVSPGDKVILWVHDADLGVYALGEVIDKPVLEVEKAQDRRYYSWLSYEDEKNAVIKIRIIDDLLNNPLSAEVCHKKGLAVYNTYSALTLMSYEHIKNIIDNSNFPLRSNRTDLLPEFFPLGKLDLFNIRPIKPVYESIWDDLLNIISGEHQ